MKRHASRRQFLTDSLLTSAATIAAANAANMSSQRATAQEDSTSGSVSPNEQVHVAIVGVNGRGGEHIKGFVDCPNTVITHLCDVDEQVGYRRCEDVAKMQNGKKPELVSDIRKLLEDKSIDAISVATPNHWHSLAAIWAIQAGKDVYCEKPVSHNVSEGRRVVQAAAKYGKIVQTGTQSRSNPGMIDAIKFIHEGGIGDVRLVRGLCYKRRKSIGARGSYEIPANIDYDLWSGPAEVLPLTRPQFHYDWHWQWPYGNGDLGNQGIHQMDVSRWALGVDQLSDQVFSFGGRFGYEDAGDTANTQVIVHDFGPKRIIFEVRGLETQPYRGAAVGLIVYGTEGHVVFPNYYTTAVVFDKDQQEVKKFSGGNDQLHYNNFIKAVQSRDPNELNAPILDGHLSSALCHLGNIAYRLGEKTPTQDINAVIAGLAQPEEIQETMDRTVAHLADNNVDMSTTEFMVGPKLKFDPSKEVFVDNAAADAMLTREYRAPFIVPTEANV